MRTGAVHIKKKENPWKCDRIFERQIYENNQFTSHVYMVRKMWVCCAYNRSYGVIQLPVIMQRVRNVVENATPTYEFQHCYCAWWKHRE